MEYYTYCNKVILLACILCMIIIFLYIHNIDLLFTGKPKKDGSRPRAFYFRGGCLSTWTISHFFFFFILGLICPNSLLLIIILGIIWECIEFFFELDSQTIHSKFLCSKINNCNKKKKKSSKFLKEYIGYLIPKDKTRENYFYWCSGGILGQILDIISNIIGYLLGALLHRIIKRTK